MDGFLLFAAGVVPRRCPQPETEHFFSLKDEASSTAGSSFSGHLFLCDGSL